MATRTAPSPTNNILSSGANAARPKGASPLTTKNIPPMIASIAIIVTPSGRCLVESLSVLIRYSVNMYRYNLVS
jgi:hypothetical protein